MNRQFPALRGLAIFLVVINHSITLGLAAAREAGLATPQVEKVILLAIKELGIIAVPIFLFLAGSFFVYAAQGKNIRQAYKLVGPGLLHTLTPYLIWSLVYYLVVYLLFGEGYSLLGYAKNLAVGYPFNFVPLLMAFYVIAPLLVWASKRYPWAVIALFFLYQLFLINVLKPGIIFGLQFPSWLDFLALPVLRLPLALWGVFYPMGVIYSLHQSKITPVLKRAWWLFALVSLVLYVFAVLTLASYLEVPLAEVFAPVVAIFLLPVIRRDWLPFARPLEKLGKRSYGLYLMNLIIINLGLAAIGSFLPWLLSVMTVLAILLAAITLLLASGFMSWVERGPGRAFYRYLFG